MDNTTLAVLNVCLVFIPFAWTLYQFCKCLNDKNKQGKDAIATYTMEDKESIDYIKGFIHDWNVARKERERKSLESLIS